MSRDSSDCPFSGASNVVTAHRWLGSGMCRRAVAYVRCLKCGARGPIAKSEHLFDVRNERPSAQTAQDPAYRAKQKPMTYDEWLLAPAAERKGEGDGR